MPPDILSQNATKISTENKDEKPNDEIATQTPATVDTTLPQLTISFQSSTHTGLTAPAVLQETEEDSDSSIKIEQDCYEMGEPCESNAESAERHRDIARKVESRKRKRDKRRRRTKKRFIKWLLTQESDEDEVVSGQKHTELKEIIEELSDEEASSSHSAQHSLLKYYDKQYKRLL